MGMRGNYEEYYSKDSHRGSYIGGVWYPDKTTCWMVEKWIS